LVFTAHIYTHGYYQAQLIPIVALPLGSLTAQYLRHFRKRNNRLVGWLPVLAALLVVLYLDARTVRERVGAQEFESEEVAREIGELVNHSSQTVFVARYYGMPLQYYGELSGYSWPKANEPVPYEPAGDRELSLEERLGGFGYEPGYFIITDFKQLDKYHGDLKAFLRDNCSLLFQTQDYHIYDGDCSGRL
jgi:hypothetical protein